MFKIIRTCVKRHLNNCVKKYGSDVSKVEAGVGGVGDVQNDKILYGGELKFKVPEGSVGEVILGAMREERRLDKIMQVNTSGSEQMTTSEFIKQSVGVAQGLSHRGVGTGDIVFVCGDNSLLMNVSIMGILWNGSVAAPISPFTSHENMKVILKILKPSFYLCEDKNKFIIRRMAKQSIGPIDKDKLIILNQRISDSSKSYFNDFIVTTDWENFKPPKMRSSKEDLAVIVTTKFDEERDVCAGLTHKNLLYVLDRSMSIHGAELWKDQTLMQVQKTIWMSGLNTLLNACYFGSKIVVVSEFDEPVVLQAMQDHKVTFMYIHPAKLWRLIKYPQLKKYDLSSCKNIVAVGARLSEDIIDLMKQSTGVRLTEVYGTPELGGSVTNPLVKRKPGSVGKLAPGVYGKVYATNRQINLGPNEIGELCFKGPGVMKGYVNDEKATKTAIDKDGYMHTRDVGSYDEDGYLYITGRYRFLIKIKDQLISPQEIEEAIKSRDDVKDVVVGGMATSTVGKILVAFVVKGKDSVTAEDIIKHVEERMEEPKRIKVVVFIPKVPRMKTSSSINRPMMSRLLRKYQFKEQTAEEADSKKMKTQASDNV